MVKWKIISYLTLFLPLFLCLAMLQNFGVWNEGYFWTWQKAVLSICSILFLWSCGFLHVIGRIKLKDF
jgi:hypothetical protein